jgi:hypothetical protein
MHDLLRRYGLAAALLVLAAWVALVIWLMVTDA